MTKEKEMQVFVRTDDCGITRLVCSWNSVCEPSLFINREIARKIIVTLTRWIEMEENDALPRFCVYL